MQSGEDPRYIQAICSPKHYLAYDLEDNEPVGRVAFTANVSQRDLVSYYLPAWRAAAPIVKSTMCSYNAVDINDGNSLVGYRLNGRHFPLLRQCNCFLWMHALFHNVRRPRWLVAVCVASAVCPYALAAH